LLINKKFCHHYLGAGYINQSSKKEIAMGIFAINKIVKMRADGKICIYYSSDSNIKK